jgi:hypothetical protein
VVGRRLDARVAVAHAACSTREMGCRARTGGAILALAVGCAAVASRAGAQPAADGALDYRAPAGCPDAAAFRRELVARAPAGWSARLPDLTVTIDAGERGFVGQLRGEGVERRLEGERCDDVVRALALSAALTLEAAPAEEAPAEEPAPAPAPTPAVAVAPPPTPVPSDPSRRPPVVRVGVGVALLGGVMPDPELDVPLHVEVAGGRETASVRLSVASLSGQTEMSDGVRAEFGLLVASLEGCAFPIRLGDVRLGGCAAFEVGRLVARAEGLDEARRRVRPWLAPVALARLRWRLGGRVVVDVAGGMAVPLVRDRFVASPDAVVHEPAPVSLRTSADIGVAFW